MPLHPGRITRRPRHKWFWAFNLDQEVWDGPFDTIDLALADAALYYRESLDDRPELSDDYPPFYIAQGHRVGKYERINDDLPYEIDSDEALKITLPPFKGLCKVCNRPLVAATGTVHEGCSGFYG